MCSAVFREKENRTVDARCSGISCRFVRERGAFVLSQSETAFFFFFKSINLSFFRDVQAVYRGECFVID